MKLTDLFEQSKGQQVITFSKYLGDDCPCSKKNKELLEEFGGYLFQNGWTYSEGVSNSSFTKGSNEVGKFRIVVPQTHHQKPHNYVQLYYFKNSPVERSDYGISRYLKLPIKPLATMVDILSDFSDIVAHAST